MIMTEPIRQLTMPPRVEYDRLEWHLQNWRRLMESGGYSEFKIGKMGLVGFTHYGDEETNNSISDYRTARMCDAVVRGLRPMEQDALETNYLGHKWLYPQDLGTVLVLAREGVAMGLRKRGIY